MNKKGSRIAKIVECDTANGEGIRTSIFFSGCPFKCKNCFNEEFQDFDYGEEFTIGMYVSDICQSIEDYVQGISILGGSPLCDENCEDVYSLVVSFRRDFPDKDIWLWTGLTWEEIWEKDDFFSLCRQAILSNIDVLIDGRFIEEEKDLSLKFRGSKNQRIIDVKKSIKSGNIVLYDE